MKELHEKIKIAIKANDNSYIENLLIKNTTSYTYRASIKTEDELESYILHIAAKYGSLHIVKLIISINKKLINQYLSGKTALIHAAANGHTNIVRYLIEHGANFMLETLTSYRKGHRYYPIHWAALNGFSETVACLIELKSPIYITVDSHNVHLIHLAAQINDLATVKLLLGMDSKLLDITDDKNQTPLLWAAGNGHEQVVQYLLQQGANTSLASNLVGEKNHNKNPIHYATEYGFINIVKLLITHESYCDIPWGAKALHLVHIAVIKNNLEILKLLLEINPFYINATDNLNRTPLLIATQFGFNEIVSFLLIKGADIHIASLIDCMKTPPFLLAIDLGNMQLIKTFINHNKDIKQIYSKDRFHLIHRASKAGQLNVVKMLLEEDPSLLNLRDGLGQTPILWAASKGHVLLVRYFLNKGADITFKTQNSLLNYNGRTAYDWALKNEHYYVINVFILKTVPLKDIDTIVSMIYSAPQAINLMEQEPSLTKALLENDQILELLNSQPGSIKRNQVIEHYEPHNRRPSFFYHVNTETKKIAVYHPVDVLGKGSYGSVRLFQNNSDEKIAVKTTHEEVLKEADKKLKILDAQRETQFNKTAYPNEEPYLSFEINQKVDAREVYSNRILMPFVAGENTWQLIPKITCARQLANIVQAIINELHRIHQEARFLHGDLNPRNIMIYMEENIIKVRFIDFGLSYYFTDTWARSINIDLQEATWIPPELRGRKLKIQPHQSQDVYQ
ncbi:MAG: ankyrin repeat domain-containing protein, partial [Legionella sp.]